MYINNKSSDIPLQQTSLYATSLFHTMPLHILVISKGTSSETGLYLLIVALRCKVTKCAAITHHQPCRLTLLLKNQLHD
jgi:hypothetical protein